MWWQKLTRRALVNDRVRMRLQEEYIYKSLTPFTLLASRNCRLPYKETAV